MATRYMKQMGMEIHTRTCSGTGIPNRKKAVTSISEELRMDMVGIFISVYLET